MFWFCCEVFLFVTYETVTDSRLFLIIRKQLARCLRFEDLICAFMADKVFRYIESISSSRPLKIAISILPNYSILFGRAISCCGRDSLGRVRVHITSFTDNNYFASHHLLHVIQIK